MIDGAVYTKSFTPSLVSRRFLEEIKEKLQGNNNQDIVTRGEICTLSEPASPYSALFNGKKNLLSPKNTYYWNI